MWIFLIRRMKHKKYLRKQVEGEDSENVSDEKEDEDTSSVNLKYIKKEDLRVGEDRDEVVSPGQIGNVFNKEVFHNNLDSADTTNKSEKDNEDREAEKSLLQQRLIKCRPSFMPPSYLQLLG